LPSAAAQVTHQALATYPVGEIVEYLAVEGFVIQFIDESRGIFFGDVGVIGVGIVVRLRHTGKSPYSRMIT
jgi:hypothetical protein